MEVYYDITLPIFEQSVRSFRILHENGEYIIHPEIGTRAVVKHQVFPGGLEFYHFGRTAYQVPVQMKSVNPPESEWYLLHVNLSGMHQRKTIGEEVIEFHKYLPAGILLYGPGLEIETSFPKGMEAEVCGMHFPKSLIEEYFGDCLFMPALDQPLTYEDLDPELEFLLMEALSHLEDKLASHALVLSFLDKFFRKLNRHEAPKANTPLHSGDYRNLMKAAGILRDPRAETVPSLETLAKEASMSTTKFKTTFKQVFGCAPMQYRNKIRLEYAREQLRKRRKTPVELSHELGYAHPSNFTAAYKKFFNALPSQEADKQH